MATGLTFALSYLYWPLSFHGIGLFQAICWLIIETLFVGLCIYDFKWQLLPDKLVFFTVGFALVENIVVSLATRSLPHVIYGLIGALIISGLFYVIFIISQGKWIGGGDVKLGIVLGLLVGGPTNAVLVIFMASLLGTISSAPMLLKEKTKNLQIPFGPFLMLATVVVFLFGKDVINLYLRVLGI